MDVQKKVQSVRSEAGCDDPLSAWREQVEWARREPGVGQSLLRESADAYEDFLDSMSCTTERAGELPRRTPGEGSDQ